MRFVALALLVVACGGNSSRRVESAPLEIKPAEPAQMAIDAGPAAIEPAAIDAGAAAIEPGAAIDAGGGKDCYCFSWVHLDENGEQCYATKPKCDAEFKQFGRDMKIPCEKDARGTCASFACRGAGKQCFRL